MGGYFYWLSLLRVSIYILFWCAIVSALALPPPPDTTKIRPHRHLPSTSYTTPSRRIERPWALLGRTNDDSGEEEVTVAREISSQHTPKTSKKKKARWICCSSSKELVHAIQNTIRPDDHVAELGAQLRDVSTAICEILLDGGTTGTATLVDVARKFPKKQQSTTEQTRTRAMRRPGDQDDFYTTVARFVEIESLDGWRRAFLDHQGSGGSSSYSVLVLDVSAIVGNDLEWTSLAIIREFVALFDSCTTVLVKSERLNQWATRILHGQRWIDRTVDGPTSRISSSEDDAIGGTAVACSPKTIATVGVEQYRQTIERTVQPGDAVLEVGCHLGTTTKLLHEAAAASEKGGYAIGVDCGPKIVRGAMERYRDIYFSVGDAWKTADLLRIQRRFHQEYHFSRLNDRIGFDVVYVDVGGLSGSDGLLEALSLVSALMNALEPRCIVIKSLCVRRLSSTLLPYWRIQGQG